MQFNPQSNIVEENQKKKLEKKNRKKIVSVCVCMRSLKIILKQSRKFETKLLEKKKKS